MATLISASLDVTKITKERLNEGKYLNITISIWTDGNITVAEKEEKKEEPKVEEKQEDLPF